MKALLTIVILSFVLAGCGKKTTIEVAPTEDTKAKAMLAGVWVDADEGDAVFMVKGDSIFYPDSTSQPVRFAIYSDTLVMYGGSVTKYKIIRQEQHLFEFRIQGGDVLKMVKSNDPYDAASFERRTQVTLNQRQLIKRDTVVMHADKKYHCYVQINPTTFKVLRSSYNDEGLAIDHVFYDNIIHLAVYSGADKVLSRDFRKQDFASVVPENMLNQCVLSDMLIDEVDTKGIHYTTHLAVPESPVSFVVDLIVADNGRFTMNVK